MNMLKISGEVPLRRRFIQDHLCWKLGIGMIDALGLSGKVNTSLLLQDLFARSARKHFDEGSNLKIQAAILQYQEATFNLKGVDYLRKQVWPVVLGKEKKGKNPPYQVPIPLSPSAEQVSADYWPPVIEAMTRLSSKLGYNITYVHRQTSYLMVLGLITTIQDVPKHIPKHHELEFIIFKNARLEIKDFLEYVHEFWDLPKKE